MKNIILFFLLFISTGLFAQVKPQQLDDVESNRAGVIIMSDGSGNYQEVYIDTVFCVGNDEHMRFRSEATNALIHTQINTAACTGIGTSGFLSSLTGTSPGNTIGIHNDGNGVIVNINETIVTNKFQNDTMYIGKEDGTFDTIDLTAYAVDLWYLSSVTGNVMGNIIATHNDGNGTLTDIMETVTTASMSNDSLFIDREDGTQDTFNLASYAVDTSGNTLLGYTVSNDTTFVRWQRPNGTTIEEIAYESWYEKRICLNTAAPVFVPVDPLLPTWAEANTWATANLSIKERTNGTHLNYFIPGEGGSCDIPDYTWVLNEGSQLVTRTQNTIITLPNYTALRNFIGYNHNVVVVSDFTYVGPDGVTYTTRGGVFKRIFSGTENGYTLLVGTDGSIWERDFDKVHYNIEWGEVGGKDSNGQPYTIYNNGLGIADGGERIKHCLVVGGDGAIIIFPKNQTIDTWSTNRVQKNQTIWGNGSTLRRGNLRSSALASPVSIGATTVTVASSATFRIGQRIGITNSAAPFGGLYFNENDGNNMGFITAIVGNVITFSGTVTNAITTGTVFVRSVILEITDSTVDYGYLSIYKLNFDGNKASNNNSIDWRYWDTIAFYSRSTTLLDHCTFKDTPAENISIAKGTLKNCEYTNLNGSFVHISSTLANNNDRTVNVENCYGNGSNINPVGMGHSEAVFTTSFQSVNLNLINCYFKNGGGMIISMDSDDNNVNIIGGEYTNYHTLVNQSAATTAVTKGNFIIQAAKFYNVNNIVAGGFNVGKGFSVNKISIKDNLFVNTRFDFRHVSQLFIEGNKFMYDIVNYTLIDPFTTNVGNYNQPAMYAIRNYDIVHIKDNLFEGPRVYNSFLQIGLIFATPGRRRSAIGVDTEYLYGQDIKVEGNTFLNFRYSIMSCNIPAGFATRGSSIEYSHVNFVIKDNTICMIRDVASGSQNMGIYCEPGQVVENNTIYNEQTNTQYGIVAVCVDDVGTAHTRLLGPIVKNNLILGAELYVGGNGNNEHNPIVEGNRYTGLFTASALTIANSIMSDNIRIDATSLVALTAYVRPFVRGWKEDTGFY